MTEFEHVTKHIVDLVKGRIKGLHGRNLNVR